MTFQVFSFNAVDFQRHICLGNDLVSCQGNTENAPLNFMLVVEDSLRKSVHSHLGR